MDTPDTHAPVNLQHAPQNDNKHWSPWQLPQ